MLRMNDAQELFSNCMPSQLKGLFDCGAIVPLAQHDSHGRFVMVSHAGDNLNIRLQTTTLMVQDL